MDRQQKIKKGCQQKKKRPFQKSFNILVVEKILMFAQIINSVEKRKRKKTDLDDWKIMGGLDVKNDLFMWKEQSRFFLFFDCNSCGNIGC